jgi:ABC-type lipoprotein release transport system permease subunit
VIGALAAASIAAVWLPAARALSTRPAQALNSD